MENPRTVSIAEIPALAASIPDIRAVIFDYGGTLDSRGDHWSRVILDAYRAAGIDVGIAEFKDAYIHAERMLEASHMIAPGDDFHVLMLKKIGLQFARLGLTSDPAMSCNAPRRPDCAATYSSGIEAVAAYCYDVAKQCTAEARPTLEMLARSYPLALVSNFYGNLPTVLADFGIDNCFSTIVESASVSIRKPDPLIFTTAISRLGTFAPQLTPASVLVVGDSMKNDIIPATTLGCHTALIAGRPWPPR